MKRTTALLFAALTVIMSSCVYSLFPIYTEDTLVFKKELLGKWMIDEHSYLLFESNYKKGGDQPKEYEYSIEIKEGYTLQSDNPIFVTQNGKKVYNEDSIKRIMNERMSATSFTENKESKTSSKTDALSSLDEKKLSQLFSNDIEKKFSDKLKSKDMDYQGSISVYEEKSYKLTVMNEDSTTDTYIAHLVEIGDDLFMDLYPTKEFDSKSFSDNFFPVHTFFKIALTEHEFSMTFFDLDKLNKLFESNLIRLRHENVEGTVLITAQPKELQKFLDKYADDESVFEGTETYKKAS
ncbi:MAG: hypothetical protein RIA69_12755 [Cyclobacteriaceae bacterium]